MAEFYADLARVYSEEVRELAAAGCRYLQIDEVYIAYLCDPALREQVAALGENPQTLPRTYVGMINGAVKGRPARHDGVHAPVPRQQPERLGGVRRLRAGGRGAVQRVRRHRLFLEYEVRAPAISSRCASCRRARRGAGAVTTKTAS